MGEFSVAAAAKKTPGDGGVAEEAGEVIAVEVIGTIATVLAVAGVVLNNHKRIECFYLWLVSNVLSLACHVMLGAWSLSLRDGIFWGLAIYGLVIWRRKDRR